MENEVARCVAEGIAERMLDALEKKVKEQMGDTPVPEKIAVLGDPIVIEIPDAVEAARNFDPYPPLDQETVDKTFKIVYPEDCGDSEKQVLYHIVLEYSGMLTSERLVEYATDKDSELLRWEMARELCDVLCRAWVNDMPGGTFMDHRPHVKVDYREYVKGNGGKSSSSSLRSSCIKIKTNT